ncbi:VOC family protein [Chelatococcus reniformis]|uniref:Extradiol dioxygenase n=1 Tax=Chelatococcus reniformis TaxID=1494448 RepID=A0A916X839_9HYPH|nr:VOC family protein [Chelatococcus reniformis]GGC49286.1 extradiol dioxygenase [Chelatococcus reniformis]
MTYKPEGHSDISIYMVASDAKAVLAFAAQVFGATELMRIEHPDGAIRHAEFRIGDSVVMVAQGNDTYTPFPVWLHLYVPDVDATFRAALAAGAEPVQEPAQKDDPDRRGGVKDPAGNTWWIATSSG